MSDLPDEEIKKLVSSICRRINSLEKIEDLKKLNKTCKLICSDYESLIEREFITPDFNLFDVQTGYHKDASLLIYPLGFSDYFGGGLGHTLLNIFNNGSNEGNSESMDQNNKGLIIDSFTCLKSLKEFAKSKNVVLFERLKALDKDFKSYFESMDTLPYMELSSFLYDD